MGRGGKSYGRELVGFATRAAGMGSCAGMGHSMRAIISYNRSRPGTAQWFNPPEINDTV
jgi:hypothetical protein